MGQGPALCLSKSAVSIVVSRREHGAVMETHHDLNLPLLCTLVSQISSQLFRLGNSTLLKQLDNNGNISIPVSQPTPPGTPWLIRYSLTADPGWTALPSLRLVYVDCTQVGKTSACFCTFCLRMRTGSHIHKCAPCAHMTFPEELTAFGSATSILPSLHLK